MGLCGVGCVAVWLDGFVVRLCGFMALGRHVHTATENNDKTVIWPEGFCEDLTAVDDINVCSLIPLYVIP